MPKWPNRAVMARKDRSWVRAVVCDVVGPMCPPTSSGGTTTPVQRWMVWRSSASLQSEPQIRSVRSRMPEVHPGAAGRAAFNFDAGMGLAEFIEQPVGGEGLFVDGGAPGVAVFDAGPGSGPT